MQPPLLAPRLNAGVAELDCRLFVVGGFCNDRVLNTVSVFDPVTEQWQEGPSMGEARDQAAVVTLAGRCDLRGGRLGHQRCHEGLCSMERLRDGQWVTLPPMPAPRYFAGAGSRLGAQS
eukprot:4251806-Prymnesium_polylepis.1